MYLKSDILFYVFHVVCRLHYDSVTNHRAVHNEYPSHASQTAKPHTRQCHASRTTEPRARPLHSAVHTYARAQSCPSHLEPFVLHTLRYEQCVLLLVIYLWGHFWPNYVGYLTVFVFFIFSSTFILT